MKSEPLLKLVGISKAFPGVKALKEVDFTSNKGEVISIVGQNGAGKSTLVNIVGGIYTPDMGELFIESQKVKISNPGIAEKLGIGMVHQEPTLVPMMTVSANLFLNREHLRNGFFLNFKRMKQESNKILDILGFKINPETLVENLSLVEREVVEIAKAMLFNPRILILDEVTAPLGISEVEHLFKLIQELKSRGIAIIFISHRLQEVIKISDRIVVLRDGQKVGEFNRKDKVSLKEIVNLMIGEKVIDRKESKEEVYFHKKPVLTVKNLSKIGYFQDIGFDLYSGEILGLAGLKGVGITELLKILYGALSKDSGDVYLKHKKVTFRKPRDAMKKGIGMITNDRQNEGLASIRSVEENITISSLDYLTNMFNFFNLKVLRRNAEKFVSTLDIKTPSLKQEALYLSGGNQQKVVLAKLLLRGLDIIMVDEPTKGIDVKTKVVMHNLLFELKEEGKGIIVTSPEISELLSICDRILIIASGSIVQEVRRSTNEFNERDILEKMYV